MDCRVKPGNDGGEAGDGAPTWMAGTSQAMTAERLMTWGVREGGASRLSPGNDEGWAWHTISIRHARA